MYPTLIQFGHLVLPTFGVLAAAGLMLGLGLSVRTARLVGLNPDAVWDAGLFGVVAALALSRLLLVFEDVRAYIAYPRLLLTGPALTGWGMLATVLVIWGWLRRRRLPLLAVLDAWSPCGALIWGFVALGHFAEGSDPGVPWRFGLRMPGMRTPLIPVALYVSVYGWGLAWVLLRLLKRRGVATGWGLIAAGVGQFGLGFLRQPDLSGLTTLLDPGQWVSLAMVLGGGVLLIAIRGRALMGGPLIAKSAMNGARDMEALAGADEDSGLKSRASTGRAPGAGRTDGASRFGVKDAV